MSSAPVEWEQATVHNVTFHAGAVKDGSQEETTGDLSPLLGWCISRVPPKPAQMQLAKGGQEGTE